MSFFCQYDREALERIELKLDRILKRFALVIDKEDQMAVTLDDLKAKVEAETSVAESAITLLVQLKGLLDAAIAGGDMAKIQEIADAIDAETTRIADAVTANTPAAT